MVTEDDLLVSYASLDTPRLFSTSRVESKTDNVIFLETTAPLVSSALSSASSASYISMKLIQRTGQAYLSFEVTSIGSGVAVVQDVPVTVLPATDATLFEEPRIPPPDVSLMVRDTRSLRHVTDRLRFLSRFVSLEADMEGNLAVAVASDVVSMKTFYRGLTPQGPPTALGEPVGHSIVRVDSKRLSKVLASCNMLPGQLLACTYVVGSLSLRSFHAI